jgi:hypothetical protein
MRLKLSDWWPPRGPAGIARVVFAALLVVNLVAAWLVWRPLGGSPAELDQQLSDLRTEVAQQSALLTEMRSNVSKVQLGRSQGDRFMDAYFLSARTASSTIIDELITDAKESKITPKEHSFSAEPIEGSDDLSMMTITGNYEGTYPQLIDFVNRLDRSSSLLIIEGLNATPEQGSSGRLLVAMKVDTFIRGPLGAP